MKARHWGALCALVLFAITTQQGRAQVSLVEYQEPAPSASSLTPEEVKKIVADYLSEEEKKKKQKADAAKAEKEAEEPVFVVGDDLDFKASWKHLLRFDTKDGAFMVHVGGRIHSDVAFWNTEQDVETGAGGVGLLRDGANFRRARIRVNGKIYENVNWIMEYGFENGVPQFFDVYGEIEPLPALGLLRIGHFREPFSLDALTSGNNLTFIERSLIQEAFVPFRNYGILSQNTYLDDSVNFALGVFRSASNGVSADAGDRNYSVTGRLTWNPYYEDNGKHALHFGIAGNWRNHPRLNAEGIPVQNGGLPRVRFRTRPEDRVNAPRFANTGFILASDSQRVGTELAYGSGPFLFQSEYAMVWVPDPMLLGDVAPRGTAFFHGGYAQMSYFLTGENRPYSREYAFFGHCVPYENFFCMKDECANIIKGRGAWEIGARYSYLNLNSQGINGGILHAVTFGLNWHLNWNTRFMFNYILNYRDAAGDTSDGLTRILASRFQIDF